MLNEAEQMELVAELQHCCEETGQVARDLLDWYDRERRDLPWRYGPGEAADPYRVWLSEIMLQQTTVRTVIPYFEKFTTLWPTVGDLAKVDEEAVLQAWAGLGYYSRARNLLKAARIIVKSYQSSFPAKYNQAIEIPGIGPYSASAILSVAYQQPYSAVDGNVIRVISRLFIIKSDIRLTKTLQTIKKKADLLLDKNNPGAFNEAVMELGATICTPKKPRCLSCPVNNLCKAFEKRSTINIPFKSPAKAKQKKYQIICILKHNSKILIGQNPQNGLLAGMWELPAIETSQKQFENGFKALLIEKKIIVKSESTIFRHIYSHIDLKYKAIIADVDNKKRLFDQYVNHKWVELKESENYAIHNAHRKVFEWYKNELNN